MKQGLGLGKGIGALIPKELIKPEKTAQQSIVDSTSDAESGVAVIDIEKILRTNPVQPRLQFDQKALEELADSIRVHGVITPITVRRHFDGYELISGERRLRASRMAGLTRIPAYVMDVNSDAQMLEIAIVENVQREDLNPLEMAIGYQRLIDECGLRQEDVGTKVGKDRSTIANILRLLKLPAEGQAALRDKQISMGHARALLALTAETSQLAVLREVVNKDLSVRKTEALVKDIELGRREVARNGDIRSANNNSGAASSTTTGVGNELARTLSELENTLRHLFGTQVRVKMKSSDEGAIEVEFYSLEELERLIDMLSTLERTGAGA